MCTNKSRVALTINYFFTPTLDDFYRRIPLRFQLSNDFQINKADTLTIEEIGITLGIYLSILSIQIFI